MAKKMIRFESFYDERGLLITMQVCKNIPFEIKRIYYILNVGQEVKRGCHAHKNEKEVAVCLKGKCTILLDDGAQRNTIILTCPMEGLYIENLTWIEMYDFSSDCILLILSSECYDDSDYIWQYSDFVARLKENRKSEAK